MPPRVSRSVLRGFMGALRKGRSAAKSFLSGKRKRTRVPKMFAKGINTRSSRKAWEGYRQQAIREQSGPTSFVMWLPGAAINKILRKPRATQKALWRTVDAPSMVLDTAIGTQLAKTPVVGKKLFKVKEKVKWDKDMFKQIERSSALAPLTKARRMAEPIIIGIGLEKGLSKAVDLSKAIKERKNSDNRSFAKAASDNMDQEFREKVASKMLHLHEECEGHKKRAHAVRFIYKQAEMGMGVLPQTHGELEEKIASLITEDLIVMEKALELTGGSIKLGELEGDVDPASRNAEEEFQAAIIEEA